MENTTAINAYFVNVLSNEDLDLLHDDDNDLAVSALEQVPAAFKLIKNDSASENDLADLGGNLNALALAFSHMVEVVPNPELETFISSLHDVARDPGKAGPTFLDDFTRIVDAYNTEASTLLHG